MTLLESSDGLLILGLNLGKSVVPTLVEVLILHEVSLLNFFALSGLIENEGLTTAIEILDLELLNSVLRHLCLDILAFHLTLLTMLFKYRTKELKSFYFYRKRIFSL